MSEEKQEERKAIPILRQSFMESIATQVATRKASGEETGNAIEVKVILFIEEDGSLSILQQDISSGEIVAQSGDDEE